MTLARAYSERIGSAAVMIVEDGVVVDAWGDLKYKYNYHSIRKSLISALYGIYVADGKIDLTLTLADQGIDDITPLTAVEKSTMVADLLAARSGIYIEAIGESTSMKALRPERGSHLPGTYWYYNNWDFNTLGTIFDQLSGEVNIYTAFDRRIADPIGMENYDPDKLSYSYESYSRHPYYDFRMSTRDLARFGLLFLRNGRWGDQQVIGADWVRLAPSASNKQPWRIVQAGTHWHFYCQRTPGYGQGSWVFTLLRLADLQRLDIGIAMCHFELTARQLGLPGFWTTADPGLEP